ncbi:hypothetical protein [Winogradskyella sediminis]|uniref:hypothetical protein n=1 Tax=Winogradskyella sediminis TaxID=1382466 RepID=UPI003AA85BFD
MLKTITLFLLLIIVSILKVNAQYTLEEIKNKPFFLGSSAFMLGNLVPDEKPNFVQLNLGYRISTKDAISLELKTWRYFEPLGIPYDKSRTDPNKNFPGHINEKGFAIAYQRFLWKGLYSSIHIMNAWQGFTNEDGIKFDKGFQIFNTYRLGYHIKLFKGKFFIEPSLAITHRPYHSKMPESFKQIDDKWSKFFFGEPGLHFGFNF